MNLRLWASMPAAVIICQTDDTTVQPSPASQGWRETMAARGTVRSRDQGASSPPSPEHYRRLPRKRPAKAHSQTAEARLPVLRTGQAGAALREKLQQTSRSMQRFHPFWSIRRAQTASGGVIRRSRKHGGDPFHGPEDADDWTATRDGHGPA